MPRARDSTNERQRQRQERYRERLDARGCQEAPDVDRAVQDALAALGAVLRSDGNPPAAEARVYKALLLSAENILAARGFDRQQARS